jgi:hypothetical protein
MNEYRVIMRVLGGFCVLGAASGIWPAVDRLAWLGVGLLVALGGLSVAGYLVRELWRELAFRAEMQALDRRDAAERSAERARIGARS